jgi:hypothetical protein
MVFSTQKFFTWLSLVKKFMLYFSSPKFLLCLSVPIPFTKQNYHKRSYHFFLIKKNPPIICNANFCSQKIFNQVYKQKKRLKISHLKNSFQKFHIEFFQPKKNPFKHFA